MVAAVIEVAAAAVIEMVAAVVERGLTSSAHCGHPQHNASRFSDSGQDIAHVSIGHFWDDGGQHDYMDPFLESERWQQGE